MKWVTFAWLICFNKVSFSPIDTNPVLFYHVHVTVFLVINAKGKCRPSPSAEVLMFVHTCSDACTVHVCMHVLTTRTHRSTHSGREAWSPWLRSAGTLPVTVFIPLTPFSRPLSPSSLRSAQLLAACTENRCVWFSEYDGEQLTLNILHRWTLTTGVHHEKKLLFIPLLPLSDLERQLNKLQNERLLSKWEVAASEDTKKKKKTVYNDNTWRCFLMPDANPKLKNDAAHLKNLKIFWGTNRF